MKYDIVSERTAPAYRISSPSDIYGALARYARARNRTILCHYTQWRSRDHQGSHRIDWSRESHSCPST